jgi:sulfatase modifying factor 1
MRTLVSAGRYSTYSVNLIVAAILAVASVATGSSARAVSYELVTVGNPGNAADITGYGGVAYDYRIGKYDVTIGQYTDFLNAVAATDTYSLYSTDMATDLNVAGILRTGSSGSFTYSPIAASGIAPYGGVSTTNRPITCVSWYDSARFANWMANGQPTGAQDSTTTENGAYNVNGATGGEWVAKNVTNPNTSAPPTFSIPTENEWYKAAYYSPALSGGAGGYYIFATQSNTDPGNFIGSGANQANYRLGTAGNPFFSMTQVTNYDANQNYLTDVGAFTNNASFYGTFDQTGNVFQWNDPDGTDGLFGVVSRGGTWTSNSLRLESGYRQLGPTSEENGNHGFRLAAPVPEPSTYAMALAGLACGGYTMFRRRRARA